MEPQDTNEIIGFYTGKEVLTVVTQRLFLIIRKLDHYIYVDNEPRCYRHKYKGELKDNLLDIVNRTGRHTEEYAYRLETRAFLHSSGELYFLNDNNATTKKLSVDRDNNLIVHYKEPCHKVATFPIGYIPDRLMPAAKGWITRVHAFIKNDDSRKRP